MSENERDTTPTTIERSDAIDAAGACAVAALQYRRQAKSRANGGERGKATRAWLRQMADETEAAGQRIQRAADNAL